MPLNANFSLRSRIFVSMIVLVLLASVLIAGITIYQYSEQAKDYHADRLERKEEQLQRSLWYSLKETPLVQNKANVGDIFRESLYAIADVQNVNFSLYSLSGEFIQTANPKANDPLEAAQQLPANVLEGLRKNKRFVTPQSVQGLSFLAAYSYVYDLEKKPLAIVYLPYYEDNSFNKKELEEFLMRLAGVYLLMLAIAILLAYLISTYITRSLKTISDKLSQTHLEKQNIKIEVPQSSEEIGRIIQSYNGMIDQLEASAAKLAKSEREQAWQEMAKQVAHEIKNPLTPMRLHVQLFAQKFDPKDPEAFEKLKAHSNTLLEQIDTLSNIATAFAAFAQMPAQQKESLDVGQVVALAISLFNESHIEFEPPQRSVMMKMDRTQLIRLVTNLVKNAIQSVPEERQARVRVRLVEQAQELVLEVSDNGSGIDPSIQAQIFEPKFTTKSSGMGLGLGMVKNIVDSYGGHIELESSAQGSTFKVHLPK
ncbi:ATP-binding protein [Flavobacteriaceae bacterium LSUCC0859]|nr:ATP-binding protein [Flavobacteriaceae bacterium LSUCC0859]